MKKLMTGFMLLICGGGVGLAQTNFYENVTNLWHQGYKSNVLAIADARLAVNGAKPVDVLGHPGSQFATVEEIKARVRALVQEG